MTISLPRLRLAALPQHRGELEPDEKEQDGVQQDVERVPYGDDLEAAAGAERVGPELTAEEACGRGRKHTGDADPLRGEIGCVAGEELHGELDRRIVDPSLHLDRDRSDGHADGDAAGRGDGERVGAARDAEALRRDRTDGDPVDDDPGRVVGQALALEDREDGRGQPNLAGDRARRQRIGRADDGAEHERCAERQLGREPVGGESDADRREEDEAHGEDADRPEVPHELAPPQPRARAEEERRQKDLQDQVGRDLDVRQPGQDRQDQTAEGQERRIGQSQPSRHGREQDDREEQPEDDHETLWGHGTSLIQPRDPRRGCRPRGGLLDKAARSTASGRGRT